MKHRQGLADPPGVVDQRLAFSEAEREGLVDDDVLAGVERRMGLGRVQVIGRGDDHQLDVRPGQGGAKIGGDVQAGQVRLHIVGAAGDDGRQPQAPGGPDQGRMDGLARIAVADERCLDVIGHD